MGVDKESGVACPRCNFATSVTDVRRSQVGALRRRRRCRSSTCLHRFTTFEIVLDNPSTLDVPRILARLRKGLEGIRKPFDDADRDLAAMEHLAKDTDD